MNKPFQPGFRYGDEVQGFSADEFLHMLSVGAFDHMKVELVDGRIVRMSPSHSEHGRMMARTIYALASVYGVGRIMPDTVLKLGDTTVRAFDVAVLYPEGNPGPVLAPAEVFLGLEVSDSSLAKDLGEKQRDYARAGIANYWVVDVKGGVVHLMTRPEGDEYKVRTVQEVRAAIQLPDGAGSITLS
jgi:Uma2 family endonuclease